MDLTTSGMKRSAEAPHSCAGRQLGSGQTVGHPRLLGHCVWRPGWNACRRGFKCRTLHAAAHTLRLPASCAAPQHNGTGSTSCRAHLRQRGPPGASHASQRLQRQGTRCTPAGQLRAELLNLLGRKAGCWFQRPLLPDSLAGLLLAQHRNVTLSQHRI